MKFKEAILELDRMRSLIGAGADDSGLSQSDKILVNSIYRMEFGENIRECGCQNKYTDAVLVLYKRLKERGKMIKDSKYELKAGVIIWLDNKCYSRHNLTDKVADKYLKRFPNDAKKFSRLPEAKKPEAPKIPKIDLTTLGGHPDPPGERGELGVVDPDWKSENVKDEDDENSELT